MRLRLLALTLLIGCGRYAPVSYNPKTFPLTYRDCRVFRQGRGAAQTMECFICYDTPEGVKVCQPER
jgi:hypothetical protein